MTSTAHPTRVPGVTTGRADAETATAQRRRGLPARARIMAWLLLLLTVALLSVVVVTRNLLLADLDAGITAELVQESGEFDEFAAIGVDPATGQPFANAGDLLQTHLARQRPGPDQVQIGVFADGSAPQAQGLDRNRRAITPEVLARILDPAAADTGEVDTPEGLVRWARTLINRDANRVDGYFVVGELVAPQRAEIDDSIRTLAAVSGIGLLLAGVASWIVSGQILAPLRLVRRTAEEITGEDLTRRITVSGRDDLSERFARGSTGGARTHRSGAGLGLAIVQAIAEAHGGRVRLDSVPGQGARFAVEVPVAGPTV